jgi:hypothetical protein
MSTPQQIQNDIERTRHSLSTDVDRLTDKVSPARVVGRRVDTIKGTATSVRERVMGTSSAAASGLGDAASSLADTASGAPQAVRTQTQGNPLAAGLIAFGVGWLASSLVPATQREQDLARAAQEKATELAEPLKQSAQEVASNMQQPLQHAAEEIKSTATEAASETADHARSAAADVRQPLQQ